MLRIDQFRLILTVLATATAAAATEPDLRFNRDIRPILSEYCYACHGPDQNKRKAGLRLDQKGPAFEKLESGKIPIVAGKLKESELFARIVTTDEDDQMPPKSTGKSLSEKEKATLKKWIESGATWEGHWAYSKPERPALPEVKATTRIRNPIDAFLLDRLQKAGLDFTAEASREKLIRRVSLDLRGLPPTIAEVDQFVYDTSVDAYERMVERMLDTVQYGERMAQHWLDLARYADTNGYHIDNHRDMWKWREWVINAFYRNKPFNEFVLEQLAGDLLPNPTLDQRIATGFNRNTMVNFEGGADPDEYAVKYVVDRVATTATVFLGSTLACAECHDHKYDPFTTKDFYRFYAYFNNIPEKGLDGSSDNPEPSLRIPTVEQGVKLAELLAKLPRAEITFKTKESELPAAQNAWEEQFRKSPDIKRPGDYLARFSLDETVAPADDSPSQKSAQFAGAEKPAWIDGIHGKALSLSGGAHISASDTADFDRTNQFTIAAWVKPQGAGGVVLGKMDEAAAHRGFDLGIVDGRIWTHLIHAWETNALKITSKAPIPANAWAHVAVAYDGSSKAAGLKLYVNGQPVEADASHDSLTDTIKTQVPLKIGGRHTSIPFHGEIDDLRIYSRRLPDSEVAQLHLAATLEAVILPNDKRSEEQRKAIAAYFKAEQAHEFKAADAEVKKLRKQKTDLFKEIPQSMVMEEMPERRKTHILVRGDFRAKGEEVTPALPEIFAAAAPTNLPPNRLGFAQWLISPDHPLLARVTVNRFWQMLFGSGLVKSSNDFGSQGEWPSHPELLDWLATEFVAKNWDVKHILKLMLTSTAYRQDATITPDRLEKDALNRLVSRGPRYRLDAEFIRDNALFVSGLMNTSVGGKSVYPYQPPGLWEEVAFGGEFSSQTYVQSKGPDLYRRGLYTYWKRSLPYPSFVAFDAPNREICTFSRARTTTPLQSLVLMNDPAYVEAARAFGARVLREGGLDLTQRITYAVRVVLTREPTQKEIEILAQAYRDQLAHYTQNPEEAKALFSNGESPVPSELDQFELAAWTALGNILFNLDETITKG